MSKDGKSRSPLSSEKGPDCVASTNGQSKAENDIPSYLLRIPECMRGVLLHLPLTRPALHS